MKVSLRRTVQQTGRWSGQVSDQWGNESQMEGIAGVKVLGHEQPWPVQRMEWKPVQMVCRVRVERWKQGPHGTKSYVEK